MKIGEKGGDIVKYLIWGSIVGVVIKLVEGGFKLWYGLVEVVILVGNKVYLYVGVNFLFVLIVVGYIVGLRIVVLVFLGGVISWWVVIFVFIVINGVFDGMVI